MQQNGGYGVNAASYLSADLKCSAKIKSMLDSVCIEYKYYAYGGAQLRTTLNLPEELLTEAMRTTHIKTKTKVIITALEELIRKYTISGLKKFKGKIDLDIDIDSIRSRECKF